MTRVKRGIILPVVLMVIVLLALLGAAFSFRIHADSASTQALSNRLQSRLAAEAGVEWVRLLLRTARLERSAWYRNPDAFNRVVVWAYGKDSDVSGTNDKLDEDMVYRFSIVADDWTDDEVYTRFGITDEASKLNLNVATEKQLLTLVQAAVGDTDGVSPQEIVDAILDWRDPDSTPRNETGGTEGEYYKSLPRPYRVKNGPFDSVEELLLVKGVTANLLYGEDFDRNGLLTENEDDGNKTFPPDNQDGLLNRGLYPYLTVLSHETNVANNNRARVNLLGDEAAVRAALTEAYPDQPSLVEFCVAATRPQTSDKGSGKGKNPGDTNSPENPVAPQSGGNQPDNPKGGASLLPGNVDPAFNTGNASDVLGGKLAAQAQRRPNDPAQEPEKLEDQVPNYADGHQPDDSQTSPDTDTTDQQEANPQANDGSEENTENQGDTGPQSADATNPSSPISSPAYLLFPRKINGEVKDSPVSPEDLPALLDLTTVVPPETRDIEGLININTAPRLVLDCIDGLTSDQVDAILAQRDSLSDEELSTTAWLLTEGIVDRETFARIAPAITARAQQFRIQSLGYADHIGTVTRLEVIVDMNGPIAQTIYDRDISYLGAPFPIREEDREQQNAH